MADTIVIQHKQYRKLNSQKTGLPSSKFGNAYYHLSKKCIELKHGVFPISLTVPEDGKCKLNSQEKP
jgi:hypothetical protein